MKFFFQDYKLNKIWLGFYYLLLILLLSAWGNGDTSPNEIYKIVYLGCLLAPALLGQKDFIPTLVVGFSGIALYGYAYSFMPTYLPVYLIILAVLYLVFIKEKSYQYSLPKIVAVFGLYTFLVDCVMNFSIENITVSLFIIILLGRFFNKNVDWHIISKYSLGLALTTFVLSAYFILLRDQFTTDYYVQGSGLERTGWMDANYFGMVVGMGVVASMVQLSKLSDLGRVEKFFYIGTVAVAIPTLVLNASRGSLLAVAISFAVLLVFSKVRPIYKIIILGIVFGFIVYLYNNSYFDLLEYRVLNDAGTGSGRIEIWDKKLHAFIEGGIFNILTGYGNVGGKELGMASAFGSHNDYIAILCAYGIPGVILFVCMLLYPIANLKKYSTSRPLVISSTLYMLVVCLTLEPYTAGRLPYFAFYLYALLLMSASNDQQL